ncbi:hypothetical protein HK096_005958, partial [Nowakowskiella sp. JEL0078]
RKKGILMDSTLDSIDKLSCLPIQSRESIYCRILGSDPENLLKVCQNIRAFDENAPSILPMIVAIRFLIIESFNRNQQVTNFEVISLLCSCIRSIFSISSNQFRSTSISVTRRAVYIASQFENILHCAFMTSSVLGLTKHPYWSISDSLKTNQSPLVPADSEEKSWLCSSQAHWCCFYGPSVHHCLELAKGGASIDSMLVDGKLREIFDTLIKTITFGIESMIDDVIDYTGTMKVRAPTKSSKKKSTTQKKTPKKIPQKLEQTTPETPCSNSLSVTLNSPPHLQEYEYSPPSATKN